MSAYIIFMKNSFRVFLFFGVVLMLTFVKPVNAQKETSQSAQSKIASTLEDTDVLLDEKTKSYPKDNEISYTQVAKVETVIELPIIVFIVFSVSLLILFALVIYIFACFASKGRLVELQITTNQLASRLNDVIREVGKTSTQHTQPPINPMDLHGLNLDVDGLRQRLERIEQLTKNKVSLLDEVEKKKINSAEPVVRTSINSLENFEIPKALKDRVENKIKTEKDLSVLLSKFISKLGKSDSELTNYTQALRSEPQTKKEYEVVDASNFLLSRKFQNYIEFVDVNNEEQLLQVNKLAEIFNIRVINPVQSDKFDAKLHSARGEEDCHEVPKGRVIRGDVLGYEGAEKSLVKAKVILSRG
jgi:molecular chaperone GrpE (heat shock protein)